MTEIPEKPYFTASEVAALLLVSTNTVRVWTNKGLLHTELTFGGHRRFARAEILRLVQERQTPPERIGSEVLRILIIDDDEALAKTMAQSLETALPHAVVSVAADGFKGGMLAHSANPHIILLDLRMPGMDGFETCKLLKGDEATRSIRIIAMSGFMSAQDARRIEETGAELLLEKPVRIPVLMQAIQGKQLSAGLLTGN
jgi:excisionase family DNA binding protein